MPRVTTDIIPRIGWFTIALNNRKRPLGVFEVRYERPWIDSSDSYQEMDVPIQGGSMITGTYNNELMYQYGESPSTTQGAFASPQQVVASSSIDGGLIQLGGGGGDNGVSLLYDGIFFENAKVSPIDVGIVNPANTANYDGYIVAIYLKCIGDITLKH